MCKEIQNIRHEDDLINFKTLVKVKKTTYNVNYF